MALVQIQNTVVRTNAVGALYAVDNVLAHVLVQGGDELDPADHVNLWANEAGTVPLSNPVPVIDGIYEFYVDAGTYDEWIIGNRRAFYAAADITHLVVKSYLKANVRDYGADPTGVSDSLAAFNAAKATGRAIEVPAGTYKLSASWSPGNGQGLQGSGSGSGGTILDFRGVTAGFAIDIAASGMQHISDLRIRGDAINQGGGLKIGSGCSRVKVTRVLVDGFSHANATAVYLNGALDNTFHDLEVESCTRLMALDASATHPANQNVFVNCKFQYATAAAGKAVQISNSQANVLVGCLFQGNTSIRTVSIETTTASLWPSQGNVLQGCYFEENGGSQVLSHGIHVEGANTGADIIHGTVVRDCKHLTGAANNPDVHIYLKNATHTFVNGNYTNVGALVEQSTGVFNTHLTANDETAVSAVSGRPAFGVSRIAANQSIPNGVDTKVDFNSKDVDTNTNVSGDDTFTPTVGGTYVLVAQPVWVAGGTVGDLLTTYVRKNGVVIATSSVPRVSTTQPMSNPLVAVAVANGSTDYFECYVRNGGTAAQSLGLDSRFAGHMA
jgi:hypothetical protein